MFASNQFVFPDIAAPSLDFEDFRFASPLHLAVFYGHNDVVRLCSSGALASVLGSTIVERALGANLDTAKT